MESPFRHAGPVSGRQFCGREAVLEALAGSALSGVPVAVAGHRGTGVSSLAGAVAARLEGHGPVARTDLAGAPGPRRAARRIAAALRRAGVEPLQGLEDGDPGGRGPARVDAASGAGPAFLVVDGAHRLVGEDGRELVAALASAADGGRLIPLCFTSRPSAAPGLPGGGQVGDPEAAGAGKGVPSGTTARTGSIPLAAWLPFALEAFLETDRWIANEQVEAAVGLTGGHPRHTQHLLHLIWIGCGAGGRVRSGAVDRAFGRLLAREGHAVRTLLGSLTPNQRRVLTGLAADGPGTEVYSGAFLRRWELASPSSVQRALRALEGRDLLEEGEEGPVPVDPVVGAWLRRAS